MLRNLFLFILLCFTLHGKAQDSLLINQLMLRIATQQVINDASFTKGNFSSFISNPSSIRRKKKDDNVFFAALINYTLQQQRHLLSQNNRLLVDSVQGKAMDLYKHFQNKNGRLTYNFWRTDTTFIFPYTNWIHRLKKNTSLPDDMDDTVLSLMAQDADSTTAAEVHAMMQNYINKNKNAKTIEKNYRSYKAYSVWYGKNFPPVFDVCVLSNILSFVQHYNLTWTPADTASLAVIIQSITDGDYLNKPLYVSPYYGSSSLILYHLARLMSYKEIPQLEAIKTNLIVAAAQQYNKTDDLLEKIILCSAIMKWGYVPPDINLPYNKETIQQIEESNLPFFIGNIPSYFSPFYKHFFTNEKWLLFYHYCPAFNDTLWLEYVLLRQQLSAHNP